MNDGALLAVQASRLCTVRQARIQLAVVLTFAVLYNAPKFAEVRILLDVDKADNSTWLVPRHTPLGESHLYSVVYCNVFYTLFMLVCNCSSTAESRLKPSGWEQS